jgi:iron complex outermembrane receptor protein
MKKFMMIIFLLAMIETAPGLQAAETPEGEVSAEELIFMEVPVVVTASRREQPVTEAPVAVTVVTAEQIRQSGALTVPDVLRMVSGVDVMTITVRDQQVGIRGLNGPVNNKLLVLIDGRTVYEDVLNNVFWEAFPIGMEEIARIEVIKSPISTLYGANAFSGVINIITRTPKEIKGTEINLSAGTRDTLIGSLIHAGEFGAFNYKLSAVFDRTNEWGSSDRAADIRRGNFSLGYDLGADHAVSFSGGRGHLGGASLFTAEVNGTFKEDGDFDYLQLDYRNGGFQARAFRKTTDFDGSTVRSGDIIPFYYTTDNVEAQYAFNAGKDHSLVTGANYRQVFLRENIFVPTDHTQDLYDIFGEDEFRISDKLRVIAGLRYDHRPLVTDHVSPRGTILYKPAEDQTVRLSVSQANRSPALLESYIQISLPGALVIGNPNLKSEEVTAYEVGYSGVLMKRVTLGVNLFYNEYSNPIYGSTTFVPPNVVISYVNGGDARGVGGELDVNVRAADWLSVFANYSYQRIIDKDDNPYTFSVNEQDRVRHDTPEHKVNAGVRTKFGSGWSSSLSASWVDKTERLITDLAGNEYQAKVASYTVVNARIGYLFWKERAEASLAVSNLFNEKHYEYPPGINLPDRSSDQIGRSIVGKVSYRF